MRFALPSMSPTVAFICASATRRGSIRIVMARQVCDTRFERRPTTLARVRYPSWVRDQRGERRRPRLQPRRAGQRVQRDRQLLPLERLRRAATARDLRRPGRLQEPGRLGALSVVVRGKFAYFTTGLGGGLAEQPPPDVCTD